MKLPDKPLFYELETVQLPFWRLRARSRWQNWIKESIVPEYYVLMREQHDSTRAPDKWLTDSLMTAGFKKGSYDPAAEGMREVLSQLMWRTVEANKVKKIHGVGDNFSTALTLYAIDLAKRGVSLGWVLQENPELLLSRSFPLPIERQTQQRWNNPKDPKGMNRGVVKRIREWYMSELEAAGAEIAPPYLEDIHARLEGLKS